MCAYHRVFGRHYNDIVISYMIIELNNNKSGNSCYVLVVVLNVFGEDT